MTIKRRHFYLGNTYSSPLLSIRFDLIFHSLKCNKTIEISNSGDNDTYSEFEIYLSVSKSTRYFTKYSFALYPNTETQLHAISDHFRIANLFIRFTQKETIVSFSDNRRSKIRITY
ncbi:hypothetical protein RF11_09532 [Thelohanellus kitauei]|uniref:Uncharacterized protein n=1 Tax=Thelohanellus kitauei TaxID=669202 RepID=A0A0C2MNE9_THEKT|nr:hypothetical protein RF11_09532 [Thelohanellus kitauei]